MGAVMQPVQTVSAPPDSLKAASFLKELRLWGWSVERTFQGPGAGEELPVAQVQTEVPTRVTSSTAPPPGIVSSSGWELRRLLPLALPKAWRGARYVEGTR